MAHILDFGKVSALRGRTSERQASPHQGESSNDFWPEVSCGLWLMQPTDPANAQRRVFGEIALILGGCGLLVALVSVFVHGPPIQ
ncbi:MAG TPA: hypothetical protein VHZ29_10480 [Rhizomicrobium sp.]|nr:hypothetical protein [Rhizomicrobium sp.]